MLEAIQNISSLISQLVSFSSDIRLYDLDTPLGDGKLIVENFVAKEEVSNLYQFNINCLSTDTHIELKTQNVARVPGIIRSISIRPIKKLSINIKRKIKQ